MSKSSGNNGGVGFLGLLTILFVGIKLTGFIDWSWWWVLSPIWGSFAFVLVFAFIAITLAAIRDFKSGR